MVSEKQIITTINLIMMFMYMNVGLTVLDPGSVRRKRLIKPITANVRLLTTLSAHIHNYDKTFS